MQIRIFIMDGYDLYWVDGDERSSLMLSFETLEDAEYAYAAWNDFIEGVI